jgi:CheY-like chemotaxis protein
MSRRRILLVDNQEVVREALARLLRSEGHEVHEANADQVAKQLQEHSPDTVIYDGDVFDGVVGLDAGSAVALERARRIELKAGEERDAVSPPPAGGHVVLPRPLNLEDLRIVLRDS